MARSNDKKKNRKDDKKTKTATPRKDPAIKLASQAMKKLRNALKNNGPEAALALARKSGTEITLRRISAENTHAGDIARRALNG